MTTLHRGDVWWADVPGDKRRPVVVLTRDRFIERLRSVIVAPITHLDDETMHLVCASYRFASDC